MLTRLMGAAWAKDYTTAHERIPNNKQISETMDLHNNFVGRQIALEKAGPSSTPMQPPFRGTRLTSLVKAADTETMQAKHRQMWLLAATCTSALATTACGADDVAIDDNAELDQRLVEIAERRTFATLADLIGGEWDTVAIYSKDTAQEEDLEKEVGQQFSMPEFYLGKGSVLLTFRDNQVIRGISISTPLDPGRYSRNAVIKTDQGSGFHVVDPK